MRFSTAHSLFGSQATALRLCAPGLNLLRHPGGGRDLDPEMVTPRSVDGCWFGLGPGLRRDDDSVLMSPAIASPNEEALLADPVRIASATLLQRHETRFYFLRSAVPSPLTPQDRGIAPLQPGNTRCRTCRLCRPRSCGRSAHGAAIAPRTGPPYLASMPHRRAATTRTP